MKLVTFRTAESAGQDRIGVLLDDGVVPLPDDGPAPAGSMVGFLEVGDDAFSFARQVLDNAGLAEEAIPLERVTLRPPVPDARKLFALAGNYLAHIQEGRKRMADAAATPRVFMKPPSTTLRGPAEPIPLHRYARGVDYEAELAVVIGRRAKYVTRADAMDYVAGYSCLNDVSERKFRVFERDETTEWDSFFDWLNGKWIDGFAPMGPALVTCDEVPNVSELSISLTVNGEERQRASCGQMIFDIPTIIEFISAFCTLEPGDIIATGTPAGVGDPAGVYLQDGDVVEVRVPGVGVLRNPVETEAGRRPPTGE